MDIRQETPADYEAVYQLVREAFASAELSDGREQDLVAALRNSPAFIPELSLVAVEGRSIIGHILFTEVRVGTETALALAPLSVLPSRQRRGIGLALMEAGHDAARRLGYGYSTVLGHPGYYPKAGYVPAGVYGIRPPFDVPGEAFMALRLDSGAPRLDGTVLYDRAFGIEA